MGLTLHDLAELIRRAGLAAGFEVQSEYPAGCKGKRNSRKVDWVWLLDGEPRAAFEIEGRNVLPGSLTVDFEKFSHLHCIKVLALYSVKNNHEPKPMPVGGESPIAWVHRNWPGGRLESVKVMLDMDLFAPGGIEEIQTLAQVPTNCGNSAAALVDREGKSLQLDIMDIPKNFRRTD